MCIICYKPAGEPLPSDDAIKHMFSTNPHGAGYALQGFLKDDKRFNVMYKKGFMKVEDFIKSLKEEGDEEYLKSLNIAMHFRIKTHGETDQVTTHPFIITNNFNETRKLTGRGKPILFHNGIFPELGGIVNAKSSDTQDYVVGVAAKYLKTPYPSKVGEKIAQIVAGDCRVLLMYPSSKTPVITIGKWHKFNGLFYSNTGYYDPSRPKYDRYGTYYGNWYEDDYDYYYYRDKKKRKTNRTNYEPDIFGRNCHEFAWPKQGESWINCRTKQRYDTVISLATLVKDEPESGLQIVNFSYDRSKLWYADPFTYQLFREDRLEDYIDMLEIEQDYQEFGLDSSAEYIAFESTADMTAWLNRTEPTSSEYEVRWGKKLWMIDTIMLEAMTMKGVKDEYKEGAWGHVTKELREKGTVVGKNFDAHRRIIQQIVDEEELEELFPEDQQALIEAHNRSTNETEVNQVRNGRSV